MTNVWEKSYESSLVLLVVILNGQVWFAGV